MRFNTIIGPAAVAVVLSIGGPVLAQPADFDRQAAALLEAAYPADGPGAAVVVTRKGKVIFTGSRGLADLDTGRPITADTPFRLGSITKQLTAAVVLQLVAEGKISLDDPLSRFFPDWPQPGAKATVRQLLNHSSGLYDYTKIPGYMLSEPTLRPNTTADLLAVIRSRPATPPGTRWEYNNGGYVVLGAIIEQVTGQPWHQAVVERIARPLGLKSIAYAAAPPADTARGYSEIDGKTQPARGVHISVAHAAGALVGSPADLARWAQALHNGKVVDPALYGEMTAPARMADGRTEPYGFGLRLRQIRGRPALVHGGAGRGLDTDAVYIPSEDLYVAVFANSDDPGADPAVLTRRLAALALGEPYPTFRPAEVAPETLAPLFGLYDAGQGPPRRFFSRDGRLFLARGDEEMEAFPAGEDRFFFGPEDLAWFRIERRPDGAHILEAHPPEDAAPVRATRTGPVPPSLVVPPEVLASYVGAYQTEGPLLTIALADGKLTITPPGQAPIPMRPVSQTEFRLEGMRLVFHPENGKVDRMTLYRGARELHGRRVNP
ncbi:MAG TPA: serine hydrolase domain-containing protein [Caulobacter sp.]|nr:serine hydrolase domain-containing protein [Caulobacter sp.]